MTHPDKRNRLLYVSIAWIAACLFPVVAQSQTPDPQPETHRSGSLWTVGNDRGLYLAVERKIDSQEEFYIFYRPIEQSRFIQGNRYPGRPEAVLLHQQRLLIFLAGGGVQSYDLASTRTEQRLYEHLRRIACASDRDRLYILAQVTGSIELPNFQSPPLQHQPSLSPPVEKETQDSTSPGDTVREQSAESNSQASTITFEPPGYIIVSPGGVGQWQVVCSAALPVSDWQDVRLAVLDDVFWILGLEAVPDRPPHVLLGRVQQNSAFSPERIDLKNIVSVEPVIVNRTLFLVAGVTDPSVTTGQQTPEECPIHYRIGARRETGWSFTPPLIGQDNKPLSSRPKDIGFSAFGQNLAVVNNDTEDQIHFGLYETDGDPITPMAPLDEVNSPDDPFAEPWVLRKEVTIAWMAAVFAVIFWRRREMVFNDFHPPHGIVTAPLLRRVAAFFLDFIPANTAAMLLFPDFTDMMMGNPSFWDEIAQGRYAGQMVVFIFSTWGLLIVYMTAFELLIHNTPGKMALRLVVLDISGRPATPKQRVLRNLVRLLECHPEVFLLTLLVTIMNRLRQRPGDLVARTVVAFIPPRKTDHSRPDD